ncbi:MAG: MaoC family dehydratase N-terminal domain-containing protein [Actinomycetota bacterium]|nr:MaoC family dehydratase N-terminal domain-containing protein [Actinomycetota bacterium]MDA2972278.1 MaoC family dehydratase N-terminal domain-containing protein [Actinomycetota bacterium]MDA3001395.1 MaoC family dehydratase N-terminal domain-containing protein [Actinomycetota bacterium]
MTSTESATGTIVDETPEAKAAFFAELQTYVGLEIGPPEPAPDLVNAPMIRHLVETVGDRNPVYTDAELAAQSVHGGIVAPPTMLQSWVMVGIEGPKRDGDGPYERMNQLLFSRGFTSVVGTNSDQVYHRYLRPGDRLTMRTVIDTISDEKTTGLGTGHFVTTRQDYYDADEQLVGQMMFRIFRFRPKAKAPTQKPKPPRPRPATTFDNKWWFDGLNDGRLLAQRCTECSTLRFPTGPMCPSCHSLSWTDVDMPMSGTIHSFVITHYPQIPSFDYPLPILLVDVDSPADARPDDMTVRMIMNVKGNSSEGLEVGARVGIVIEATDPDMKLPFAVLEGTDAGGSQ